jgi:hypothetical protein
MDDQPIIINNTTPASVPQKRRAKIVIIIAGVLVLAVAALVAQYMLSYHNVYIDLADDISSVTIFHKGSDDQPAGKLTSLDSDRFVAFKDGNYIAIAGGENVDPNAYIEFSVAADTKDISLQPYFNQQYLDALLTDKSLSDARHVSPEELNKTINTNFGAPDLMNIAKGQLVGDGSWYVGLVTSKPTDNRTKIDQYKIILHNAGAGWYTAAPPAFVFRYSDFPEIPREVIGFANKYEV